jgi:hypothetical protein
VEFTGISRFPGFAAGADCMGQAGRFLTLFPNIYAAKMGYLLALATLIML